MTCTNSSHDISKKVRTHTLKMINKNGWNGSSTNISHFSKCHESKRTSRFLASSLSVSLLVSSSVCVQELAATRTDSHRAWSRSSGRAAFTTEREADTARHSADTRTRLGQSNVAKERQLEKETLG